VPKRTSRIRLLVSEYCQAIVGTTFLVAWAEIKNSLCKSFMCCRTLDTRWSKGTWVLSKIQGIIWMILGMYLLRLSRQEKFNLTHSRLHNVIERTFRILKVRWHILDGVLYFHREKQKMIIMSCFAMHNYLYIR
jgi:hypothetical protein